MGFRLSQESARDAGIKFRSGRSRFDYFPKNKRPTFFMVVLPEMDGYEYREVASHKNLATIEVTSEKTGKSTPFTIGGFCLGANCPACEAADRQHELAGKNRPRDFYKVDKARQVGKVFLMMEALSNGDGTFRFDDKVKPQILDYRFNSRGNALDWDNLVLLMRDLGEKRGITDPTDPNAAVIIRVDQKEEAAGRMNRTAYKHSVVDIGGKIATIKLPENWQAMVQQNDNFDDLHFRFDADELNIICQLGEAIDEVKADPGLSQVQKAAQLTELFAQMDTVKNEALARVIEALRTKEEKDKGGQGQGGFTSELQNGHSQGGFGGYSNRASAPLTQSAPVAPAPVAQAPVAQAPAAAPVAQAPVAAAPAPAPAAPAAPAAAAAPAATEGAGGETALQRLMAARAAKAGQGPK